MNVKVLIICLLLPVEAFAQGFSGLGTTAEGFATPTRGTTFAFPQDHGAHPEYRIEWWYVTANMRGSDGQDYGLQWTLFRSALAPETREGWDDPQVWMGHAAITTPTAHYVAERLARGGIGQAGAIAEPLDVWIDDWQFAGAFENAKLTASGSDFAYDVTLETTQPIVFHGDAGYSVKSAQGRASYYYSQPFYDLTGTLTLPTGDVAVTGTAWLDREWSSQPLSEDQTGWDWFSLSFDYGNKLMGFRLRQRDGSYFTSGTWIEPDGQATPLKDGQFLAEPMNLHQSPGASVPTEWRVQLPSRDLDVTVTALNPNT